MSDISISRLGRMLSVLDLFDDARLTHSADEIAESLNISLPTTHRYIRLLLDAGLVQRVGSARYTLGPRIILLDYYIRKADPVLTEGVAIMRELVALTGFDCVTSGLYGTQLLDTHRERGSASTALAYGRGRPRPLFRGAAPKVILSKLAVGQLRKLFDQSHAEIAASGLPTDWADFRRYFLAIRKRGYYLSVGELEPQLGAIAAPIEKPDGSVWAALSLVFDAARMRIVDPEKLADLVVDAARRIGARLA